MNGWLILLGLIALAVLAPLYGADSRDGQDWQEGSFPGENRRPLGRSPRPGGGSSGGEPPPPRPVRERPAPAR